jgi:serine/threonine protein kinase
MASFSNKIILPDSAKKRKWRSKLSSEVKENLLEKQRTRNSLNLQNESEEKKLERREKERLRKQRYRLKKRKLENTYTTGMNEQPEISLIDPSFYLVDNWFYYMPHDIPGSIAVDSVLGEGTFGKVYRILGITKYSKTGLKAIKLYKMDKRERDKEMCMQESEVFRKLSALKSSLQYIVQFYGAFYNPDLSKNPKFKFRYMMITDYCEYDLEAWMKNFSLDLCGKFSLIFKLSEAINWLHHKGRYMHRDIKPKNILIVINSDGTVSPRINDFGAACNVNYKFKPPEWKQKVSTVEYESIEQIWNNNYTFKVDYWAMGIIFEKILLYRRCVRYKDFNSCWLKKYQVLMRPPPTCRKDWISYTHVEAHSNLFEHGLQSYLLCLESEDRSIDNFVAYLKRL